MSSWSELPDILLENIYVLLNWRDRHACSQVCWNWYYMFDSPRVWRRLIVKNLSFTYRRFNLYKGYQREVSQHRVQMCLSRVGHNFRSIIIKPNANFHNLFNFISVLNSYMAFFEEYPMQLLEELEFTFACETIDNWTHETIILGTGGQLLEELKRLLGNAKGLKKLVFNHLLLEGKDTPGFLDGLMLGNRESLVYLEILNSTKYRHPLFYAGMFPNLRVLVISPTQLSDSVVVMIAEKTKVREMVIVQDRYTGTCDPVSSHGWWEAKSVSPELRVQLELRGRLWPGSEILIQPLAPVSAVVYNSTQSEVSTQTVLALTEEYKNTLRTFGHMAIHRKHRSKSFYERADTTLVLLIRECPKINTLMISERVSTCTLLVIATEAKHLKNFHVRKNAVILKCDWPKSHDWTEEFYQWLKVASSSYEAVETEISNILGYSWYLLTDKHFLTLKV